MKKIVVRIYCCLGRKKVSIWLAVWLSENCQQNLSTQTFRSKMSYRRRFDPWEGSSLRHHRLSFDHLLLLPYSYLASTTLHTLVFSMVGRQFFVKFSIDHQHLLLLLLMHLSLLDLALYLQG